MKNNSFETVAMVGPGYIGLPMASRGLRVIGIDIRADVVDTINGGRIHIFESGLKRPTAK